MYNVVELVNVNLGTPTPVEIAGASFVLVVAPDGPGTVSVTVSDPGSVDEGEETGENAGDQP